MKQATVTSGIPTSLSTAAAVTTRAPAWLLLAAGCTFLAAAARAQSPGWAKGFVNGGENLAPSEACAFDAGSGERVYICSWDQYQSGPPAMIRRHDGNVWDDFHADADDQVLASAVWNDGSGPALYLAGNFSQIGGVAANHIARFDGTSFTPLGSGIVGEVDALAVHDDGSGPALFAVGVITSAGGVPTYGVARWNGTSWGGIPAVSGAPDDLVSFDDGTGPKLYVCGDFIVGLNSPNVLAWDGSAWTPLPGLDNNHATAICVHDDGTGPALYVANGSIFTSQVLRWNGASWTPVGAAFDGKIFDLSSSPVGGSGLIALGEFSDVASRWDGTQWTPITHSIALGGCSPTGFSIANFDPVGGPPVVVLAGCMYEPNPGDPAVTGTPIAWDGQRTSSLFAGHGLSSTASAQLVFDDGTGDALYAAGTFHSAGYVDVNGVARWNGAMWSPLGNGLPAPVRSLAAYDDGGGPRLYASGSTAVYRWNGATWTQVGAPMPPVNSMVVFDDGSGPALYAAAFSRVKRWNGAIWTDFGAVVNNGVTELAVHDSGSGPELYAAGSFQEIGGTPISRVARWNGTAWTSVGSGPNGTVNSLLSWHDAGGPALYIGGSFTLAGGVPAPAVAKWQGGAWSSLGTGLGGTVMALETFNDQTGGGRKLFAGGSFTVATPGGTARNIARWYGGTWSPLGVGIGGAGARVETLCTFRSGWTGLAVLAVGGFFGQAGGEVASNFVEYGPLNDGIAVCFGDDLLVGCPCGNPSPYGEATGCANSTGQGGALRSSGEARVSGDGLRLLGSGMPGTSFVLYYQGTGTRAFGAGTPVDDGLSCVGGSVIRLAIVPNQGGASVLPSAQFPTLISVRGQIPAAGGTRVYQGRYRDLSGPCGTLTNRTNALIVTWRP